ncbi:PEP/pyruvate-binding domain-containing protein [uncultured Dietzia sp.]|uniref:PEP/pyruvate-binding domain-containing protein n=1 Tax=uncultured Dietzia sp. TaxID=395519 RepID=UPI0025E3F5E3|nr:PEP/pyruvate-binding domain-containing protein [uncultured Dietzia sp.]
MSSTVVDLEGARGPEVGGKAAPLAELLRAGFDVPAGFVVPRCVFRDVVAGLGIAGPTQEAREKLLATALPPSVDGAIVRALDRLTGRSASGCVAVRSSSSSEDTDRRSAAGQHHSALAVRGRVGVRDAIRACWASTWNERAVAYRAHGARGEGGARSDEGAGADAGEMAVLVQEWVDPHVSGVMFTWPEATGGSGAVTVIEATWGIGDGLVSGRVTPDSWTVDGTGVLARRIGAKAERGDRVGGRIVTSPVPAADRARPCLRDDDVRTLHGLGVRISQVLGGPRDVEWALEGDRIRVLQARPVTAELPAPAPAPQAPGRDVLRGVAGAAGTATGRVRHVRGPADFRRVRPGDVLVCRETDPAWTPLFTVAAAVITATGGVLSHAAIVAREVGIPAVLGVEAATARLAADAVVHVDGGTGAITLVGPK